MKWMLCVLAAVTACAPARAAETAQDRGKRVVQEALAALGGDNFLKMEDRVESGRAYSFYRGQLEGLSVAKIYTRYVTPPAVPKTGDVYVREREAFGKDEADFVLFTDEGAWEVTFRGATPLDDKRVANFRDSTRRNIFYILHSRLKEPGLSFYSQGSDRWENRPVEIVEITDANGDTETVYFDAFNKLPVRQTFRRKNTEYKDFDTETTLFAKYREIGGGVKWPFDIRRDRNGEKIFEMYSDSVEINKNLTDNLFTLPAKVKMLPKAK